ncbi:MAG: ATP-grasp domain-containing protein [bacterium]|nr:ATP-grasp domain-containing protein [bacterium]
MKVAIVYNRDSQRVINLFGMPNQEKIGLKTIDRIASGLRKGGHQVVAIEGDKDLVNNLEHFMPRVVKGEFPGLVFNVSYGIQGQARYTHVPSILEMVGVPYVGSGPLAHSLALDKVVAKMIFKQHGIPTPEFTVMDSPDSPVSEIKYPAIVKPKNEAVSFGIKIVHSEDELREGASLIFEKFKQPVLVEQYIEGREVNVGLLGNNPPETLPPVELIFGKTGPAIYTYEDKTRQSGREISWECPANLPDDILDRVLETARQAFDKLGCYDCARVDIRLDAYGNLFVLEVNSLPSLGEHGSFTIAAEKAGLDFDKLVCRLVEVASARYFGTPSPPDISKPGKNVDQKLFSYLVERRDRLEKQVEDWCHVSSRTSDPTGMREAKQLIQKFANEVGLLPVEECTDERTVWTWQTKATMAKGVLLVAHMDVPIDLKAPSVAFRRDPEWLYGEGVGSSRAPIVCIQSALRALRSIRKLKNIPLGLLIYTDEGRDCRYSSKLIREAISKADEVLILRPGNLENSIVPQRRGWRKYRFKVSGSPRRLGKIYKKRGVLKWATDCLESFSKLTSKEKRFAVATSDFKTESYPQMLPHRVTADVIVSFLNNKHADELDISMQQSIKTKDYKCTLELVSERPPLKKSKKSAQLYRQLDAVARNWEIPLEKESSLSPSVGGLAPSRIPTICGIGPVARDVDTPQEAVLRISLMQRTLLLAQFLLTRAGNKMK